MCYDRRFIQFLPLVACARLIGSISLSLATFVTQVLADFQSTAAVVPSSRMLAQAMVEPLPLSDAKFVVELGPGTGVMTRELLDLLSPDARVLAFEVSPRFVEYLRRSLADPRLEIVHAGAEAAARALRDRGWEHIDAVVSSLGLGLMPDSQQHAILSGLMPLLGERSVFTQFQYVHRMHLHERRLRYYDVGDLLRQYFQTVQSRTIWRNLPPAYVFNCRK